MEPGSLAVPRRIDKTVERVARARSHARTAKKSRRRRKAIVQLRKLRGALEELQTRTIEGQVTSADTLEGVLKSIERTIKEFTAKNPRRRRLRKMARKAKALRHALRDV